MIKRVLAAVLAISFVGIPSVIAYASPVQGISSEAGKGDPSSLDEALAPYREALEEVNAKIGSKLVIPEDKEQEVYNNIKDQTPAELAEEILKNYTADCGLGAPRVVDWNDENDIPSYQGSSARGVVEMGLKILHIDSFVLLFMRLIFR